MVLQANNVLYIYIMYAPHTYHIRPIICIKISSRCGAMVLAPPQPRSTSFHGSLEAVGSLPPTPRGVGPAAAGARPGEGANEFGPATEFGTEDTFSNTHAAHATWSETETPGTKRRLQWRGFTFFLFLFLFFFPGGESVKGNVCWGSEGALFVCFFNCLDVLVGSGKLEASHFLRYDERPRSGTSGSLGLFGALEGLGVAR